MLTKEWILQHKEQLAAAMVQPARCGGATYIGNERFYRYGGCLVPENVASQGSRAIEEYLRPIREALRAKKEVA
jgi:hypothetical protein